MGFGETGFGESGFGESGGHQILNPYVPRAYGVKIQQTRVCNIIVHKNPE